MSAVSYPTFERESAGGGRAVPVVPDRRVMYRHVNIDPAAYETHPAALFNLNYKRGDGYRVVWDEASGIYGYGNTIAAARKDFQRAVRQHLEVLESEEKLSEELAWQLEYLRARVRR